MITLKEKVLAVVIVALLAFGLTLGPAEAQEFKIVEGKEEQVNILHTAMQVGWLMDKTAFTLYVQAALIAPDPQFIEYVGLKFAHCHILWRNAVQKELYNDKINKKIFAASAERALRDTETFFYLAGGDPRQVAPKLIPGLVEYGVALDAGDIAECAALDMVSESIFEEVDESETPDQPEPKQESPGINS